MYLPEAQSTRTVPFFIYPHTHNKSITGHVLSMPVFNPFLMKSLLHNLPNTATAHIHYMTVLAALENYIIPTTPNLSVEDIINSRIYSWYLLSAGDTDTIPDETGWFSSYE
jgi:hypothetical protein